MRIYLLGKDDYTWFAGVPGRPVAEVLGSIPAHIRALGTLRLGLPNRDVDLFSVGEEREVVQAPGLWTPPPGCRADWLKSTSRVSGIERHLQKMVAHSREGIELSIVANPRSWYLAVDQEYARGAWMLRAPGLRAEYLRLRAEGKKHAAYAMIGVRYNEERVLPPSSLPFVSLAPIHLPLSDTPVSTLFGNKR